jgi:hypothetical protein
MQEAAAMEEKSKKQEVSTTPAKAGTFPSSRYDVSNFNVDAASFLLLHPVFPATTSILDLHDIYSRCFIFDLYSTSRKVAVVKRPSIPLKK